MVGGIASYPVGISADECMIHHLNEPKMNFPPCRQKNRRTVASFGAPMLLHVKGCGIVGLGRRVNLYERLLCSADVHILQHVSELHMNKSFSNCKQTVN